MRIKLVKAYKDKRIGEILEVSENVGLDLINKGNAILTKDMTEKDIKVKNGNPS